MIIQEALKWASKKIPALEAEILLAHTLGTNRTTLYKNIDSHLKDINFKDYQKTVSRRTLGEPIAYLTHHKEFYGYDFYVDKRVLIPRPETETLIDAIHRNLATTYRKQKKNITLADIGTGCGCISIVIANTMSKIKIYATDISKKALLVAKENAENHNLLDKIKFLHGDLLEPLPEKVNVIVANLPYVDATFLKRSLSKDYFEPRLALDGGKDGLRLILKLLKQAPRYLKPKGIIFLEIAPNQKQKLKKFVPKIFPNANIAFYKDLARLDRVILIRPMLV